MSHRHLSIDNIDPEEPSGLSFLTRPRTGGASLSASVVADTFDSDAAADLPFDEDGDEGASDAESGSWVDSTSELVRVDPDGSDAIPSLEAFAAFKHLVRSAYSAYLAASREERDIDDVPAPHPSALSRFVTTVFPSEAPSIGSPNLSAHSLSASHSRISGAGSGSAGDASTVAGAGAGGHASHLPSSATAVTTPASSFAAPAAPTRATAASTAAAATAAAAATSGTSPSLSSAAAAAAAAGAGAGAGAEAGAGVLPSSLSISLPSHSTGHFHPTGPSLTGSGGSLRSSSSGSSGGSGGRSLEEAIALADAGYTGILASRYASEVPLLLLQQAFALAPAPGAAASVSSIAPEPAAGVAALTYDLILALIDGGHVSCSHVLRAIMRTQDGLPDLMLDAPAAPALIDAATAFFRSSDTLSVREAEYLFARTRLSVALLPAAAQKHAYWPAPTQPADSAVIAAGIAAAKRTIALGINDSLEAGTITVAAAGIADTAAAAEQAYRHSLPSGTAPTGAEVAVLRDWIGFECAKLLIRAQLEAQTKAKQRFVRRALAAVAGGSEEVVHLALKGGSGPQAAPMTPLAANNIDKISSLAAETAAKRAGSSGTRIVIAATEAERAFTFLLLRYDDILLDVLHAETPFTAALVGAVKDEVVSPGFLGKLSGIAPDAERQGPGRVVERARRAVLAARGRAAAAEAGEDDDDNDDDADDDRQDEEVAQE